MSHYRDLADGWANNRGGGPAGKTYAEFVAHITALAVNGNYVWNNSVFTGDSFAFRTTASAATGAMGGSPWLAKIGGTAMVARIVQHAMPSLEAFNALLGTQVFVRTTASGVGDVTALDRNGFLSSDASGVYVADVTDLIYWDGTQAQRVQPRLGLGPTPYTWP